MQQNYKGTKETLTAAHFVGFAARNLPLAPLVVELSGAISKEGYAGSLNFRGLQGIGR